MKEKTFKEIKEEKKKWRCTLCKKRITLKPFQKHKKQCPNGIIKSKSYKKQVDFRLSCACPIYFRLCNDRNCKKNQKIVLYNRNKDL